ncbi:MAG: quinolinate synthase NadA, partial [Bacteroidia bacterium]|nr:quinolinate synthase NadA [Bacteroidia bacterium]
MKSVEKFGFLAEVEVPPTVDLFAEIAKIKSEKNAVILAHYYQDPDIQDIADYIGDSLGLAQQAAKTTADIILFCGVHFMAETAKILSPTKKVILPDLNAGCSLSDSCPAPVFAKFKEKYPDHIVISYVNCSAELKALCDVIVTSSNAVHIVNSFPPEQKIIFAPDKNLGSYINRITGRNMLLWDGACMVHEIFSRKKIEAVMEQNPTAELIAHPECEQPVLELASYIGSTTNLLNYVIQSPHNEFIVATEPGILHQMQKAAPNKKLIPAPSNQSCACNNCPHMKLNTLEKVYICLKYELPELTLSDDLIEKARKPILKMLE